ncbi:MAG TPA: caspase family protein [Thermoanaerobaculia bacterium]|nr:caspase family protein [Thermoanaerobaculia bacterium]
MRQHLAMFVALSLIGGVSLAGVRKESLPPPGPVEIAESAALFVGVREFSEDETLTEVRYAVDDAVDLAHLLVFERPLVHAKRVVLALSGSPQKEESRRRLAALKAAGAIVRPARHPDIVRNLRHQAALVGENGLFIAAFATHGINDGGTQHLLTASSLLQDPEMSVTETKVREIVSRQKVPRALILIDACREQLTKDIRSGSASPRSSAAQLMEELGKISGQAVLSAAVAGQYAYDHDGNGVFTAAVIDGLRCGAARDEKGFVTVYALSEYVEDRVLTWIQKNRDPEVRRATQKSFEGRASSMPLSACNP